MRHVANSLKEFTLANTTGRLSLRPVATCAQLESLHLQRQTKNFDVLRSLTRLRYLRLSGVSLPDLSALLPFEKLQSLFLGFCGPLNLDLLGRFPELEAVHFIKINNLLDVSALRLARSLKRIELQWLPHVETLPDLSELTSLEEVEISTMKSLRDVSSIAKVPALRFLGLWDCKALTPPHQEGSQAKPLMHMQGQNRHPHAGDQECHKDRTHDRQQRSRSRVPPRGVACATVMMLAHFHSTTTPGLCCRTNRLR